MFNSSYRIKKQWGSILDYFNTRTDFYPFKYGTNLRLTVEDEQLRVYSRRDYNKKQEYIFDKYGEDATSRLDYDINLSMIIDDTEKKVAELLGTKKEVSNGKDRIK